MININRPLQSPASLQTQAVKDYLDEFADWQKDYSDKWAAYQMDNSQPKPNTQFVPKNKPNYRNFDLLDAFDACFFAKCYLTEKQFNSSFEMDVEHFLPKSERPDLRYEWSNLYPADHDANMMKPNGTPEGGYLDPCNPEDDVENEIVYHLDFDAQKCTFDPVNLENIKAVNTCRLLDKLHNGHDEITIRKTAGFRLALYKKRDLIHKIITAWKHAKEINNQVEEIRQRAKLKAYLSRKSSYTMLMRSTSLVREYVPNEFLD